MDILGKIFNISGHGDNKSSVTINGKTYVGNSITVGRDGKIIIDGKEAGQCEDRQISIEVVGDVERVETSSGNVTVTGNCGKVKASSGNIKIGGDVSGDVDATSGSISVGGSVSGSCSVTSGIIKHNTPHSWGR